MQAMFDAVQQCLKDKGGAETICIGSVYKILYLRWRQLVKLKCRFVIKGEADLLGTHDFSKYCTYNIVKHRLHVSKNLVKYKN